jgi:nucleoside-diphosphate-sugar epimerase
MNTYENKKVLLIGGGGTLGTYTAKELLRLGASVDVLCPEGKKSDNEKLCYVQGMGDRETLAKLFTGTRYDGIVNFIHYPKPDEYKEIHGFLIENTDHLIFLSSYRVYANEQHPITETAPRLYDVIDDPHLRAHETYAISKSICEDFLTNEHKGENWTIVRPVISFSDRRLDLLLYSGHEVLEYAAAGKEMPMPETVRDYSAGIDWAGNSGKLIANLLFKKDAIGEIFTVYSGHGLTWGEVADIYSDITGATMRWCPEKEFLDFIYTYKKDPWYWRYDRAYNRDIDCSKILRVTGLKAEDFVSVRDGILNELAIIKGEKQ